MDRQPSGVDSTTSRANNRPFSQAEGALTDHSLHSAYCTSTVTSTTTNDMPPYSSSASGVSSSASRHGNDSEKSAMFTSGSVTHSRTAPQERPMFSSSSSSDPFVQTDNRLAEEYSRRIHCYISDTQGDNSTPREHMPPPVLPPFASLHSEQEMPFWRPPRVLQRDPHYNQAAAYHSHLLPQRFPPPTEHAAVRRPAQSPRHQAYGSYTQCRPTAPPSSADQSLVTGRTQRIRDQQQPSDGHISSSDYLFHGIASNPPIIVSSIHSSTDCSPQRKQNYTSWRMCNAESSAALTRHSLTTDSLATTKSHNVVAFQHYTADADGDDRDGGDYSSSSNSNSNEHDIGGATTNDSFSRGEHHVADGFPGLAKSSELRLPPISRCHTAREPMSIACLVDAEDSAAALAPRRLSYNSASPLPATPATSLALLARSVVLPQISNLASTEGSSSRHISALALSQLGRSAGSHYSAQESYALPLSPRKRSYGATEAAMSLHKMARVEARPLLVADIAADALPQPAAASWSDSPAPRDTSNLVVITCYHASVAQKSYGGEKRFLCPPPAVLMRGEGCSARVAHHSPMLLSVITDANVTINPASPPEPSLCSPGQLNKAARRDDAGTGASSGSECGNANAQSSSSAHAPLECQTSFNERNVALFKSLHVTGMQKAKSFRLRLDLLAPSAPCEQPYTQEPRPLLKSQVYASLESDPVAIISKPSKKTAKARNQSTCIRAGSLISLFNRINSQTFRTKYLNVDHLTNRWVAQSHNWSPLEVVVLAHRDGSSPAQPVPEASDCRPLYYGSEIVFVESRRNFRSPPMIIHKVERGRYVENACSPVSQMQKVALQLKPMAQGEPPRFLKADAGHYGPTADAGAHVRFDDPDGSPELTFETLNDASTAGDQHCEPSSGADGIPELDDAFCWTIVGISAFTYSYSIPHEQPQPLCHINTIPRVFHAWVVDNHSVHIRAHSLDLSTMQLMLGDQPLDVESCSRQSDASKSAESHTKGDSGASSSSTRSELGELYAINLSKGVKFAGPLSIRRADGVMYHTKWSLRQREGGSQALEVIALKLDI
ncbi:hypothetical protein GGI17_002769 [Coemansia sp. S146]|nr:hypothetical protein GGI17_002769 [Coemansia sp. S146]